MYGIMGLQVFQFASKNEVDILEDLNTFENEFATYINKQTGTEKENQIKEKNYWLNA